MAFEYIEGPKHGVPAGEGLVTLDFRLRAKGLEALYRALSKAIFDIKQERREELSAEQVDDKEIAVWFVEDKDWFGGAEPNYTHIAFSSPAAMRQVRARSLLADCAAIAGDVAELTAAFDKKVSRFTADVRAAYSELRKVHTSGSVAEKQ